ncbi:cation transporter [Acutalibacter caecimuris]|uniref:cation transporter n=1 Tax=Acutalibacter caecimuris TaxID=3093657 RepID=UPI002AC9C5B8|nr:cation transporter [Acutalibacter sp. M00118]
MKKTYKIEVDCANCANLMENAAAKTAGVQAATVNYMTQKMIVEFADGQEPATVMENVLKACRKVEPDCEIFL